jgi:hypothetical protein
MTRILLKTVFVCLFTVAVICSCKKDDDNENGGNGISKDNTITATVVNGLSFDADVVKLEIDYEKSNGEWDVYVVENAHYVDGGFILHLPEKVDDMYLSIPEEDEEFYDNVTVSNRNVKYSMCYLCAYKSDDYAGYFYHGIGDWRSSLVYANGYLDITGSYTETDDYSYTTVYKYNVHLKKGWNMVYDVDRSNGNNTSEYEVTSTAPLGAEWCFDEG